MERLVRSPLQVENLLPHTSTWAKRHVRPRWLLDKARDRVPDKVDPLELFASMLSRWAITRDNWGRCRKIARKIPKTAIDHRVDSFRLDLRRVLGLPNLSRNHAYQVARVISSMTWREVETLKLWSESGFIQAETARGLGLSAGAVCRLLSRAKVRLVQHMGNVDR